MHHTECERRPRNDIGEVTEDPGIDAAEEKSDGVRQNDAEAEATAEVHWKTAHPTERRGRE